MIHDALRTLIEGRDLDEREAGDAVESVLSGDASAPQIAALATALRMKGETVTEICAAARALRRRATAMAPVQGAVLDTCGTGGGPASTFNVSTCAAVVVASCGIKVAKHGLRAVTSRTGSADVVEALGVRLDASREVVARCLRDVGIGFFYAPSFHVALSNAGVVRQELGFRTIFDLLGPLANPAGATHQLLGVHDRRYLRTMAEVLALLGTRRAWVLHGGGGIDEVSPAGPTEVVMLRQGVITESTVVPSDFGLERVGLDTLRGGDPTHNAEMIRDVLAGHGGGPRTAVLLNAAAALAVADVTSDLREAAELARDAIDSGRAAQTLARCVEASND
jgi:anthranilate phosphoribosyltransferase